MAQFFEQFRLVFRRLAKAPLFTAITLITLAIGIGANTVIFSIVDGVILKPLDYPHPEQLIGIWHSSAALKLPKMPTAQYLFYTYREQSKTLDSIAFYNSFYMSVTGQGDPQRVRVFQV